MAKFPNRQICDARRFRTTPRWGSPRAPTTVMAAAMIDPSSGRKTMASYGGALSNLGENVMFNGRDECQSTCRYPRAYASRGGVTQPRQQYPVSGGLAEGAAIPAPVRLGHVVEAVRRSRGTVVSVTEAEIIRATRQLASMGFYCEPTSAVSAAAVRQLLDTGTIQHDRLTVVVLTGTVPKTAASMDLIING